MFISFMEILKKLVGLHNINKIWTLTRKVNKIWTLTIKVNSRRLKTQSKYVSPMRRRHFDPSILLKGGFLSVIGLHIIMI